MHAKHILLLLLVAVLAACMSDDENDYSYTLTDDAAITAFSIGTLRAVHHTTSSAGTDSTYYTTHAGSACHIVIDQLHNTITADSLPVGTQMKFLVNITAKSSALVSYLDSAKTTAGADTIVQRIYNSSDSIDFAYPRTFRVYRPDGTASRDYTIHLVAHTEAAAAFTWQAIAPADVPQPAQPQSLPQGATLLGTCATECYAIAGGAIQVSADNGATWRADNIEATGTALPTQCLSLATQARIAGDDNTYRATLIGTTPGQAKAQIWHKIVDLSDADTGIDKDYEPWAPVFPPREAASKALPALEGLSATGYLGDLYAIGKPYTQFYRSTDGGLTWTAPAALTFPAGFDTDATATLTTDGTYLYIKSATQAYRVRRNDATWATPQSYFK